MKRRDELAARLLETFALELEDQTRALNLGLLALERDPQNPDQIKAVFRAAHTIKGAARVTGVAAVEELTHALESLFVEVREGRRQLERADFALLFAAVDALQGAAGPLRAGSLTDTAQLTLLATRLNSNAKSAPAARFVVTPPTPQPPALSAEPSPTQVEPETGARTDGETPETGPRTAGEVVRVQAERLDELLAVSSELVLTSARLQSRRADWYVVLDRTRPVASTLDRTVMVALQKVARDAAADARAVAHVASELNQIVQRVRMRTFGEVTDGLPRAVRDITAGTSKEVELTIEGTEVEADRLVMDRLREPLLHLVRNAVDHGIEPAPERIAKGKPAQATVAVKATLQSGRLVVTVRDDGGGINVQAVRAKLAARGRPAPLTDRDLARALLQGGVSTAAQPTAISGRGVGLDLVREALDRMGGAIDVSWTGEGTTVTLEAPPTPAVWRAVIASVTNQLFAFPTTQIETIVRIRPEQIRQVEGNAVIEVKGAPIALKPLAGVLGAPLRSMPLSGVTTAIVLSAGGDRVALVIDELISEEEIVIRPLEHARYKTRHIPGGALLASGRVALGLNAASIMREALAGTAAVVLADPSAGPRIRGRVLVVDDSITTRTLERSVLEAAGYQVAVAVDGLDGWEQVQVGSFDAVVSDVDMPRMDGFQLCEQVRGSREFAQLPIVLVTARGTEEDRARGLKAGADAYIVKSTFDQSELVTLLRELIG